MTNSDLHETCSPLMKGYNIIKIFTHRIPKFTKIVAEKLATTSTVMEI